MKCIRCNEVDVDSYIMSSRPLTVEEMGGIGYCVKCWRIVEFEQARFMKCPYKKPIDRKIL